MIDYLMDQVWFSYSPLWLCPAMMAVLARRLLWH